MYGEMKTIIKIPKIKAVRPELTLPRTESAKEDKLEKHIENTAGKPGRGREYAKNGGLCG